MGLKMGLDLKHANKKMISLLRFQVTRRARKAQSVVS
jgi:hypothetical protein